MKKVFYLYTYMKKVLCGYVYVYEKSLYTHQDVLLVRCKNSVPPP